MTEQSAAKLPKSECLVLMHLLHVGVGMARYQPPVQPCFRHFRYMDKGELVPDALIIELIVETVGSLPSDAHVLLDGFPRTRGQAEALDNHMHVDVAVNLDVPERTILERLTDRWIHPASGRVYAYSYRPPREHGKDDETGDPLIRRDDDSPEVVTARLKKYSDTTKPLLNFYEERGLLKSFSGTLSDEIYKDVGPFLGQMISR